MGNSTSTKLKIETVAESGERVTGAVLVEPQHSVQDVRLLIREGFDEDMIPQPEFYFVVDSLRLGKKQESQIKATDLVQRDYRVEIVSTNTESKKRKANSIIDRREIPTKELVSTRITSAVTPQEATLCAAISESTQKCSAATRESNEEFTLEEDDDATHYALRCTDQKKDDTDIEDYAHQISLFGEDKNVNDSEYFDQSDISYLEQMNSVYKSTTKSSPPSSTIEWQSMKTGGVLAVTEGAHDEIQDLFVATSADDCHANYNHALRQSRLVLTKMKSLLGCNPNFCSKLRRKKWEEEIFAALSRESKNTLIGMLGATGAGKSSLLNALLDEASVLPTSGSRGCTATVVELRFNKDLRFANHESDTESNSKVPAYKGEVEFITLFEWQQEVKILVDECCTKKLHFIDRKLPQTPIAAAAWQKLNQVYGCGTMEKHSGKPKHTVNNILRMDNRIVQILTPNAPAAQYNTIIIEKGFLTTSAAKELLQDFSHISADLKTLRQTWAKEFREQINDYVYRKGNGDDPQTWPLIRKVVLSGPWSILSTGAVLVDLPGIRDANAARSKVAETYLKICDEIWIVAPIKRAVDDGTAKELLGEQFKRQLLMDGSYGNVSFVCTQTDSCEATETMQDHKDVAIELRHWDCMVELSTRLELTNKKVNDLRQEQKMLRSHHVSAFSELITIRQKLESLSNLSCSAKRSNRRPGGAQDLNKTKQLLLQERDVASQEKTLALAEKQAQIKVSTWTKRNHQVIEKLTTQLKALHLQLKSRCALVRNEYSKNCIKRDFSAGLQELLYDQDDDEEEDTDEKVSDRHIDDENQSELSESRDDDHYDSKEGSCKSSDDALESSEYAVEDKLCEDSNSDNVAEKEFDPNYYKKKHDENGFNVWQAQREIEDDEQEPDAGTSAKRDQLGHTEIAVFCVSANDYLKIQRIKQENDGPPSTFTRLIDTQIPLLRDFVHATTSKHRLKPTKSFVNKATSLLDQLKLNASKFDDFTSSHQFRTMAEKEIEDCQEQLEELPVEFQQKIHDGIQATLLPSLKTGAVRAKAIALSTARSWGSTQWSGPSPMKRNILRYNTYKAAIVRSGRFDSNAAGSINFNYDLYSPMEKECINSWQKVMDWSIISFLENGKSCVSKACSTAGVSLTNSVVASEGKPSKRMAMLASTVNKMCALAVEDAFLKMNEVAKNTQRNLNRFLLKGIQERMEDGYQMAQGVETGTGVFARMKKATAEHVKGSMATMFDEPIKELMVKIREFIADLETMLSDLIVEIHAIMVRVYSVCWDECEEAKLAEECHRTVLPDLDKLSLEQNVALDLMGIAHQPLDLNVDDSTNLEVMCREMHQGVESDEEEED